MLTASIPVKPYVRKHLENKFGNPVMLRQDSAIGKYFYQLLEDPSRGRDRQYSEYTDLVTIRIPEKVFLHRGCMLTDTNITNFNSFVEDQLKQHLRLMIDILLEFNEVEIKEAILIVYHKFNLDETVLPYETIKKDYYRYRKRSKAAPHQ